MIYVFEGRDADDVDLQAWLLPHVEHEIAFYSLQSGQLRNCAVAVRGVAVHTQHDSLCRLYLNDSAQRADNRLVVADVNVQPGAKVDFVAAQPHSF